MALKNPGQPNIVMPFPSQDLTPFSPCPSHFLTPKPPTNCWHRSLCATQHRGFCTSELKQRELPSLPSGNFSTTQCNFGHKTYLILRWEYPLLLLACLLPPWQPCPLAIDEQLCLLFVIYYPTNIDLTSVILAANLTFKLSDWSHYFSLTSSSRNCQNCHKYTADVNSCQSDIPPSFLGTQSNKDHFQHIFILKPSVQLVLPLPRSYAVTRNISHIFYLLSMCQQYFSLEFLK